MKTKDGGEIFIDRNELNHRGFCLYAMPAKDPSETRVQTMVPISRANAETLVKEIRAALKPKAKR